MLHVALYWLYQGANTVESAKRMIASGLVYATASASASPRIAPVLSKISKAILSPCFGALCTSAEVISSIFICRSESSSRISKYSLLLYVLRQFAEA